MARAGIALGSNMGDSLAHLRRARTALRKLHKGTDADFLVSPVFETDPVDCEPGSPAFFNAVIELDTDLDPLSLLNTTQAIERAQGRPDNLSRNAPRTIDVDLLYCDEQVFDDERLTLPHPRLRERRFVLAPLAAIRPELIPPGCPQSVTRMLDSLNSDENSPVLLVESW